MCEFVATYINDLNEFGQLSIVAADFEQASRIAAPEIEGLRLVCLALKGENLDGLDISH